MGRRRLAVLIVLTVLGGAVGLLRAVAPDRFDALAAEIGPRFSHVPEPVVLALLFLGVLAVWIAAMILVAKLLYWVWQQIDDYVFWLWDHLLPESPLIRFAVGVGVLLFLVGFVPLLFLQAADLGGPEDQVNETLDGNATDVTENETATGTPNGTTGGDEAGGVTPGLSDGIEDYRVATKDSNSSVTAALLST